MIIIISWHHSQDGGVRETSQVCHDVRVVHVLVDCFGNPGPNKQIGCAVLKRFGPQNHFCFLRWPRRTIPLPTTLSLCRHSALSCCTSRL